MSVGSITGGPPPVDEPPAPPSPVGGSPPAPPEPVEPPTPGPADAIEPAGAVEPADAVEPAAPVPEAPDPPEPSGSVALGEEPQATKKHASNTPVVEPRALSIAEVLNRWEQTRGGA
ncbi:hypothetical protein [Sorangium sp. So ce1153]|uniref:hypothetical protein n=1 Tax=Sorangium sp. So ce1153 TaxID=3133333 RepID=UPI003F6168EB